MPRQSKKQTRVRTKLTDSVKGTDLLSDEQQLLQQKQAGQERRTVHFPVLRPPASHDRASDKGPDVTQYKLPPLSNTAKFNMGT